MSKKKNSNLALLKSFYGEDALSVVESLFDDSLGSYKRNFKVEKLKDGKTFRLTLALPGFKPTDLTIEVYNGTLSVTARKKQVSVRNSVYLGIKIVEEKTKAKIKDGVLTLEVVKAQEDKTK